MKGAAVMEITEKVAYLKGLAEGMELDTDKKVGKLLAAIIDTLDDIALELEDIKDEQAELADGLDAVSDDLEDVENVIFDEWDEDDEDDGEYYYDDLDEDEECYATTCPTCEETIYFDESVLEDGEVLCPNCGERLEFDLEGLDEEEEDGE
jgi:ssDNA-binding Zn-finger/Zn-ribbon topoisomerase 1